MNETTYTIISKNSNYVEEVPGFNTEATQDEIDVYVAMADIVTNHEDGSITIEFEFDDDTPNEVYTIEKNDEIGAAPDTLTTTNPTHGLSLITITVAIALILIMI